MFVVIDNKDMDFLAVDAWINDARDNSEGKVISPDFAMEVLSKTNHFANIKKVLTNIKKNCTTKEQLEPYREFILSCVDEREMSANALKELQTMAKVLGEDFEKEFDDANNKPKFYGAFDCEAVTITSKEEFEALDGEKLKVYYNDKDLEGFYDGGLSECDFSIVEELKFRDGALINLTCADNLPYNLDVSMCRCIELSYCKLIGIDELKFRDGARVGLYKASDLPDKVDFSMCSEANLRECDFSGVKEVKFKDKEQEQKFMNGAINFKGRVVYAGDAQNIPVMVNSGMEME